MKEVTIFDQEYISSLVIGEEISKNSKYYQANSANETVTHIENCYTRVMIKIPTETGKALISKLIALSVARYKRVFFNHSTLIFICISV